MDPTPAFTAASRSRQLAATGKLQPSVGENTADAAVAVAVGIDSVSQSGEKTVAVPLAVTTFSHNVWPYFLGGFFEGILLFFLNPVETTTATDRYFSVTTATGQGPKLG